MAVTQFTTADMVTRIRRLLPNPGNTDFPATVADIYPTLQEAENEVKRDLLAPCPWLVLQDLTLMTTADSGLTWAFGTDADGNAIAPFGAYAIFRRKEDYPDFPMQDGVDYMLYGATKIRMPSNRADPLSYPDGAPYFYGNIPTVYIDATHDPTLIPVDARILVVWKAVESLLIALGADEADATKRYDQLLYKYVASFQLANQNAGQLLASRATTPTRFRQLRAPYSTGSGR